MRFNRLIPELTVTDLAKSLDFYTKAIGFKIEYLRKESRFAFMSLQGSQFMIQERNKTWQTGKLERPFGRGVNFQISVKELNPILARLNESRQALFANPQEHWYRKDDRLLGNMEFLVQDPDGYLLRFSKDIGSKKIM